jgi:flagellar motor switch/type III secretory pathway protein FliN
MLATPYLFEDAPQWTRQQARAHNALLGVSFSVPRDVLVPFLKDDVSVRVVSVGRTDSTPRFASSFVWSHIPTQKRARISIDAGFALSLIESVLGATSQSAPRPLSEAEDGILSALLLSACERMNAPFVMLSDPDAPSLGVSVLLSVMVGSLQGSVFVSIEPGIASEDEPLRAPSWALLTPMIARLLVGKIFLSAEEFSSLLPSDTIIADVLTCDESGNGMGFIRANELTQEVSLAHWQATTQGRWMEEKQALLGATVELSIELGRVPVRLQDLSTWKPGAVVPIGHAPGDPVHLVANGKVVAHGEIVRIDNELGVRLTWVEK